MATVAKKSRPVARAAYLSLLAFASRVAGPSYDEASCTVIRRIMAVTASQRLMLQKVNGGNCSDYPSSVRNLIVVVLPSELRSSFSMVTGLCEAFASAHAMALENGQPTASCVL
jgi:hypothetical protein